MREDEAAEIRSVLGYGVSTIAITELILRDFDNSWDYYKFNLEERRDIISRIYTFIGIPLAASSSIIFLIKNGVLEISSGANFPVDPSWFVVSLILVVYGQLQIFALCMESGISRDYLKFLNNVREYVGLHSPDLRPFLKYNKYEKLVANFLELANRDKNADFRKFSDCTLDNDTENTGILDRIERDIRKMKSSYWRASSAIFIVSLSYSSLALSIALASGGSFGLPEAFVLGFAVAFLSFVANSKVFVRFTLGRQ